MRSYFAVILIFLVFVARAHGADFKVTALKSWKVQDSFSDRSAFSASIYKNTNSLAHEMVITESFIAPDTDADFQENLVLHKMQIEKARAQFFGELGFSNFALLDVAKTAVSNKGFKYVETLQARFRDLDGRDVQMVERQYFASQHLFVVTYLIDAKILNDRSHAHSIMDGFSPIAPAKDRIPANEVLSGTASAPADSASASIALPLPVLNMKDPEIVKRCESVPLEKRRTESDPSFLGSMQDAVAVGTGCVSGVFDSALGLVKGLYETGKFAVHYAYSWVAGTAYADQVNATVGAVAAEAEKSPSAFAQRILAGAYSAGVKYAGDFFQCMNSHAQMHAICAALASMNPRILVTLATKLPLAAAEAVEVEGAMKKAVGAESKLAEAEVASEARPSIMTVLHSNESRIGVDIGGTKTAIGVVEFKDGKEKVLFSKVIPTFPDGRKGFETEQEMHDFMKQIATTANELRQEAEKSGHAVSRDVGVGSPGSFENGRILPSENPGMGLAFDGYHLSRELTSALAGKTSGDAKRWRVFADNDGAKQRDYGIFQAAADEKTWQQIKGQKVAYIGPGTGLGGGFAEIANSRDGQLVKRYYTDGHIGDVLVDGKMAGYDLISGKMIQDKLGISAVELSKHIDEHRAFVDELGTNLGKIIETFHDGNIKKGLSSWSPEDTKSVQGTSVFILGGSIGTRGELAQIIQAKAREYLKSKNLDKLVIIPINGDSANAGILGATLPPLN